MWSEAPESMIQEWECGVETLADTPVADIPVCRDVVEFEGASSWDMRRLKGWSSSTKRLVSLISLWCPLF